MIEAYVPTSLPAGIAMGIILGGVVGSFLATLAIRWPAGRTLGGRSSCDDCGKRLGPAELIPLLSYALLRGRCRRCGARIDRRHPAIEILAAIIGAIAFVVHPGMIGIATAIFGWWLLTLAILDVEHQWLPDRLTLPLIAAGLAVSLLEPGPPLADRLIGAGSGFVALAAIASAYRRIRGRQGLGGGDPKLFAAIGAWLGWSPLPLVLLGASLLGLGALLVKRARGGQVAATDRLPLGTLLALAAWPIWLLMAAPQ